MSEPFVAGAYRCKGKCAVKAFAFECIVLDALLVLVLSTT